MKFSTNNMMRAGVILFVVFVAGCGGAAATGGKGTGAGEGAEVGPDGQRVISKEAREEFAAAVEKYKAAEAAGWTPESCKSVADRFADVAKATNNMPEALYDVGAVYRKCKMLPEAKSAFETTLKHHPNHQLAMTHLATMELEAGNTAGAEEWLRKAVAAGKNTLDVVPAYVNAATLLRIRGKEKGDKDSFRKAEANIRRALAIESKFMPALYQLALLYLDVAVSEKKMSYVTLATLVCNQGIALNPEYGPIYHALGQIYLYKNELVEALKAFESAFTKDPSLFASYMNFAAINLSFRGFEGAKLAFEKAIALNPKSYDAHIGIGVALRGLNDYEGAKAEYQKAAEIDPQRTDYIFNVGLLEMDYLNQGTVEGYEKAKQVFVKFLEKATDRHKVDPDGKGPMLSWYAKAEARIKKCDDNAKAIVEAQKEMAEIERLQAEQAKREAEMKAQLEKAKELEKREAAGEQAPGGGVDLEGEEGEGAQGEPAGAAPALTTEGASKEEPKAEGAAAAPPAEAGKEAPKEEKPAAEAKPAEGAKPAEPPKAEEGKAPAAGEKKE